MYVKDFHKIQSLWSPKGLQQLRPSYGMAIQGKKCKPRLAVEDRLVVRKDPWKIRVSKQDKEESCRQETGGILKQKAV